jgi:hypothetical protein
MAIKTKGKQLVIDASVARSCGGSEANYPTSVHCRDFLNAVLELSHQVVMNPAIRDEWNKHESSYALAWRRSMVAKKRLVVQSKSERDPAIWDFLEKMAKTDRQYHEITKDICLLEAALASDRIIISLDENTARKFFNKAAVDLKLLRSIAWLNPDKIEDEQPIAWIQADCPLDEWRMLGYAKRSLQS